MFNTKNNFNGASFDYENESCKANGEFRYVNSVLNSVTINGSYEKEEKTYNFWANRDINGNINISGIPSTIIVEVAAEVVNIVTEIEKLNV